MPADLYRMDRSKPLANQVLNLLDRMSTDFAQLKVLNLAMTQEADDEAGTLSTRTNNTVGIATLGASHRILSNSVVNVQWSGGSRLNVEVGTVSGTSVPFSGGTGTDLPAQDTVLTMIGYRTVAEQFGYLNSSNTMDPSVAKASYDEINAFLGNAGPSLEQCCARHRQ